MERHDPERMPTLFRFLSGIDRCVEGVYNTLRNDQKQRGITMGATTFAILIGINEYEDSQDLAPLRYAEKDCQDMYQVLTNAAFGIFSKENSKILLGAEASTRAVEAALYTYAVKERSQEDTLLVYFSGHGFLAGDRGLAYLATHDVNIKDIIRNPNAGLQMRRVFEDYFLASPAKNVIFIVDCCHSGALTPISTKAGLDPETRGLIDKSLFSSGAGRVAMVACPPDAVSRESPTLENGIFTHFILRGLKGEAAESDTGEVSLDSLLSFVRIHSPAEQPPGSYGHNYGRIVLSVPGIAETNNQPSSTFQGIASVEAFHPTILPNPIDPYMPFIENILALLTEESKTSSFAEMNVLNIICKSLDAEHAFILKYTDDGWFVKSTSNNSVGHEGYSTAVSRAISIIARSDKFTLKYENVYYPFEDVKNTRRVIVVTPLTKGGSDEYFVVYGIKKNVEILGDVLPRVLQSIFYSTRELTQINIINIESAILDTLRKAYGYVPSKIYERKFELFTERLKTTIIHFEPILYLEPGNLYIASWEALARDPDSISAPGDLFDSAELWGRKFITELDIILLSKAVISYKEALVQARVQRPYEIQDISVNVYPETLLRSSYFRAVQEVLKESRLASNKLFLEISEKSPIPDEVNSIQEFKDRLTNDYIRNLKIGGFAIDDFGVGHASVSRLARLEPEYVKVDRDVLLHGYTETTLKFVLDLATQGRLRFPKVMIEGFDGTSPITLRELYNLGIRYVQGYQIGKSGPKLYRLEKDTAQFLTNLLTLK
jgi:uncharacterized caspase-like protein/EAL domain-containing protein (putative c-di-GMP-specific phosphodiesterase class I)